MAKDDEFFRFMQEDLQHQANEALKKLRSYPVADADGESVIFYISDEPVPVDPDRNGVYKITDL